MENFLHFGYGPHECLGREIALTTVTILLKVVAGLKNLRPAPGTMGTLKSIFIGTERSYLTSDWAELTFDPTSMLSTPPSFFLRPFFSFFSFIPKKKKRRFIIKREYYLKKKKAPELLTTIRGVVFSVETPLRRLGPWRCTHCKERPYRHEGYQHHLTLSQKDRSGSGREVWI